MRLNTSSRIGLFLVVSTLLLSSFPVRASARPASSSQNLMIAGVLVLASYQLDICSAIYLGSCPISLDLSEHYSQPLSVQIQSLQSVLQPQMLEETLVTVNPGPPSLALDFNFSIATDSYDYSVPLPTLQAPGVFSATIPLTQVLANLVGLGIPASLLSRFISLSVPISLISSVQATPYASGFDTAQTIIIWNDPSTVSYNATLTGALEDSVLGLSSFHTVFSVDAQLDLKVPLLSPIQLFSFQRDLLSFGSSDPLPIGDWYHIAVSSPYSEVSGSGWYASGSSATFSVKDQSVVSNGTRYDFVGWTGVGPNSYTGSQATDTITVTAPTQEKANWQSPSQVALLAPESVAGLVGIAALVAIVALGFVFFRRRQKP